MTTIEVDNRVALNRFNRQLLPAVGAVPYPHVMVIDGNDDRGIDVGLVSRFPIATMRSHVDDLVAGTLVFSRDSPEYEIKLSPIISRARASAARWIRMRVDWSRRSVCERSTKPGSRKARP